jgi:exodeoxyribonuclease VII large subunit
MTANLVLPDTLLSVAGVTTYIQDLLEQDDRLQHLWITGEVSSATPHRSGIFFTLQDPDTQAAISCIVWASQVPRLATVPMVGEQLILLGKVQIHPQRGSYQLIVWQALPGGEGLRALRYRQLKNRLEAEGLFDEALKQPLPTMPQQIAVVTSPQAAAWGDIQRTLRQRSPGLRVLFSPATVQGDLAPASIVAAIARIITDGRAELLILSRGGGAKEDLDCFNDERVVRAIATCPIPVISGIGHQRDESLADLAADVCAHTPTAAAEQAVPNLADLYVAHQERTAILVRAMQLTLSNVQGRLAGLRRSLQRLHVERYVEREQQSVLWLRQRLMQATVQRLETAQQKCQFLAERLQGLDPAAILQRGYAVVRQENQRVVRSPDDIQVGDRLTIDVAQGKIQVKVEELS